MPDIKNTIFAILTLLTFNMFGQDTTVTWLRSIDTTDFKVYYNKKKIPTSLLKYIEVDKLKEIANPGEKYRSGCLGPSGIPHIRLNWIATDKRNHFVISMSFGGKGRSTHFYYLDNDSSKTNINELSFDGSFPIVTALSFGTTTARIKTKEFFFEEYEEPDPPEE